MTDPHASQRRFVVHSAHQTVGVSAGMSAPCVYDPIDLAFSGIGGRSLRVCLLSERPPEESEGAVSALQTHLWRHYWSWSNVSYIRTGGQIEDKLAELAYLDESDCLVLYGRRLAVTGRQLERVKHHCHTGRAVVGVRTAGRALENWPEMDTEVFGSSYRGHFGNRLTEVEPVEAIENHPVLLGVEGFASRGTLHVHQYLADDVTVLLNGTFPGQTHPVAWVRPYCGGRVFYTSAGHPLDWQQPEFLRLLANAVMWTCVGNLLGGL